MKRNKAIEVMSFMTKSELKEFASYLSNEGNTIQQRLFSYLRGVMDKDVEMPMLFQQVYEKPYSKTEDYIIRNDLRHVARHLQAYLCGNKHPDEWTHKLYFLDWLIKRQAYHLFWIEWRKAKSTLLTLKYYKYLVQLNNLQVSCLRVSKPPSGALFQEVEGVADENRMYLQQVAAEAWMENEYSRLFALRSRKTYNHDLVLTFEPVVQLDALMENNKYLRYLWLKINTYLTSGPEKIALVKEITGLLPDLSYRINSKQEHVLCLASIALEHFLRDEDEMALQHYEQVIPELPLLEEGQYLAVLFNYVTTLLRNHKYEPVVELIGSHEPRIRKSALAERFYCIWSMCYLFLNRTDEAYACLPEGFLKYSRHDHVYLRCILSIIFYQQGNLNLAITEMHNIKQTQVYLKEADPGIHVMIGFLQQFYEMEEEKIALPDYPQAKKQLYRELETKMADNGVGGSSNLLPLVWLRNVLT